MQCITVPADVWPVAPSGEQNAPGVTGREGDGDAEGDLHEADGDIPSDGDVPRDGDTARDGDIPEDGDIHEELGSTRAWRADVAAASQPASARVAPARTASGRRSIMITSSARANGGVSGPVRRPPNEWTGSGPAWCRRRPRTRR
jgi:hypothetical protein